MHRSATTLLIPSLLAALSTAAVSATPAACATSPRGPAARTKAVGAGTATLALGAIAVGLLAPEAQAALQADVIPAATNAADAAAAAAQDGWANAKEWWTSARQTGDTVWGHGVTAAETVDRVSAPARAYAATMFTQAADYARTYPTFATAAFAAGTVGAACVGALGKAARYVVGGLLTLGGFVAAGVVAPADALSALHYGYGTVVDTTQQALEVLSARPSYEPARAAIVDFVPQWAAHAAREPKWTTVFSATGWFLGWPVTARAVTAPFRLLRSHSR